MEQTQFFLFLPLHISEIWGRYLCDEQTALKAAEKKAAWRGVEPRGRPSVSS